MSICGVYLRCIASSSDCRCPSTYFLRGDEDRLPVSTTVKDTRCRHGELRPSSQVQPGKDAAENRARICRLWGGSQTPLPPSATSLDCPCLRPASGHWECVCGQTLTGPGPVDHWTGHRRVPRGCCEGCEGADSDGPREGDVWVVRGLLTGQWPC